MIKQDDYVQARQGLMLVVNALLETIEECGERGAPLGPMYSAFMRTGMSYETFTKIVEALEAGNKIKVIGHVAYFKRVAE